MEYMGASDYYFWEGIEKAQKWPKLNDNDHIDLTFGFINKCTKDCIEAYRWGLCFGQVLTKTEYKKLTTLLYSDILKTNTPKELDLEEVINTQVEGNC